METEYSKQVKKTTQDLFDSTKSIFEAKINDITNEAKITDFDHILNTMYLMMYREKCPNEMIQAFHLLGIQNMLLLLGIFGGKTFSFETVDSFKDYLLLALIYYFREIKGLKQSEIKKLLPFNLAKDDWISYGIRLKNFKDDIKKNIDKSLKNIKEKKGEK